MNAETNENKTPLEGESHVVDLGQTAEKTVAVIADPEASSLFTKPLTGEDPHGGGDMFASGDASATVFLDWFMQ